MTRRQERAQRKALEAAVSIVLLGAALLLVPLIFSRTSPFGRAFAPLWPLALLFMAVGAAIFSVRLRAGSPLFPNRIANL